MSIVQQDQKKCPYCAEIIKREAIVCRFCGRDLSAGQTINSDLSSSLIFTEPYFDSQQRTHNHSLSWDEIWFKGFFKPSVANFEELLTDPQLISSKVYYWIVLGDFVGQLLRIFILVLMVLVPELRAMQRFAPVSEIKTDILFLALILRPLLTLVILWFFTHLTLWFTKMLGGVGSYFELVYLKAAYLAPAIIIITPLYVTPVIGYLRYVVSFYLLILEVIALKTVSRLSWGRSIIAVVLSSMWLIIVLFVCTLGILLVLLFVNETG